MNTPIQLEKWADARQRQRSFYMAVLDAGERMTFVNATFLQSFRCAKVAIGKAEFQSLIHAGDQERVNAAISDCRRSQAAVSVAARVKNSPYQWIQWQISVFPRSENGRLLCLGED